ncbi:MAG: nitrogenase associated protein [Anaerolineae bacterium]|nr:nitrogenase associated protein [Anaerolineae bacterium]
MDNNRIAFQGTLQQLLDKVESGDMVPKLQASHAPPCKFWTAFQVINGIRHVAPVIHGPKGCTYSVASAYKMRGCEYRGVPLEPTSCTAQDEADVVFGGEGKLLQAVKEADQRYHPELIVILSCCCAGIIGDDVELIAQVAAQEVDAQVLAIRSEGFGGDFRSGYEDAFKALMDLMEPRGEIMEGTINIIGAREGPTFTEWVQDLNELERLVSAIGAKINGVLCGGCTVEQIRKAASAELNASWCYDWGQKLGDLMEGRFGIPYARTGQPYGPAATAEWIMGVAIPLGLEAQALEVIRREEAAVGESLDTLRRCFEGRTALIEISEFPGPIRALSLARMAEEFGAHPIIINLHPYTVKERMPSIKYLLEQGQNPDIILAEGLFALGSFNVSSDTQGDVAAIAAQYDAETGGRALYVGSPLRQPGIPQLNMTTITGFPQYGYAGIRNIARLMASSLDHAARPRSGLFRQVLYGA